MNVISEIIEAHIFRKRDEEIEFLLMKRAEHETYPNVWQMVTGGVHSDETGYEAALREIKEETSLKPTSFWIVPRVNSFYYPKKDSVCMVPVFAAKVDENVSVKLSKEHSEFKWVDRAEAKKLLAWDGQRKSVDLIFDYFLNETSFLNFVKLK